MDWQCVVHPGDYSGRHYWEVTRRTTRPKGATQLWQWWGRVRDMTKNNNLLKQLLARQMPKPSTTLGKPEVLSWLRVRYTQAEVLAGFSTKVRDSSAGIISLPQCPFSAYIAGLLEHTVSINVAPAAIAIAVIVISSLPLHLHPGRKLPEVPSLGFQDSSVSKGCNIQTFDLAPVY